MRFGFSLNETYLLILAVLVTIATVSTIYGQFALKKAAWAEQIDRIRTVNSRVRMLWWLIVIFSFAFWFHPTVLIIIFAIISFFALREFIALTPTKSSDHWALVLSFYVVIPLQYALVALDYRALFTLFIPVYLFLLLPVLMAVKRDNELFFDRVAKIQWGLMLSIYCISHAPALLNFEVDRFGSTASFLLIFFLLVVFLGDLFVVIMSAFLGGKTLFDNPHKTVKGLAAGGILAVLCGYGLFWMTPFRSWQALLMSLVILGAGTMGDMVIAAVKRSIGSRFMDGDKYMTRGVLERLAPLMFAAPLFYHITQAFFLLNVFEELPLPAWLSFLG
ncbi:MAG TPA: phosphatidate cytidylyltransferase [Sutterella sp.]|nr:phosphatidate cytidylyltransferase [Sutterella sp.]